MEDHNEKILALLKTKDDVNIALAFQLCVGKNGVYDESVAEELRKYPFLCIEHHLEITFIRQITRIEVWQAQLFLFDKPFDSDNIPAPLPDEGGNYEKIQGIPPEIVAFRQLKNLMFSDQNIRYLPPYIGQLTMLESLELWMNNIDQLPPEIESLTQLKYLSIGENKLGNLPKEVGNLTQLEHLNLADNSLMTLPTEIGQLTTLEFLDISGNDLAALPDSIGELSQLTILNIKHNPLKVLPATVGQLTALEDLSLNQELMMLPIEITHLQNLRKLDVWDYQLPVFLTQKGLPKLEDLYLKGDFEALPCMQNKLPSLKHLTLENKQRCFPVEILQLTNLETLNLQNNEDMVIPEEIVQLRNLKTLYLPRPSSGIARIHVDVVKERLPWCEVLFDGELPF